MVGVRADLLASLPPLDPEMPPNADEVERRRRVLADVDVLERGNWLAGIFDLRLSPFDGGPGINALDYWIRQCDDAIADEQSKHHDLRRPALTTSRRRGSLRRRRCPATGTSLSLSGGAFASPTRPTIPPRRREASYSDLGYMHPKTSTESWLPSLEALGVLRRRSRRS